MIKTFTLLLVLGSTTQTMHDQSLSTISDGDTGGALISAGSLNTIQYTGWFFVGNMKQAVLAIDYTNDTATVVTMTCKGALVDTGANGTGFDLMEITKTGTAAVPVFTSAAPTWSNAVTGNEDWSWVVDNIPLPWLNCAFAGTGAGVDDVVTVTVLGVSP